MDRSIFTSRSLQPRGEDLEAALAKTFKLWQAIEQYALKKYPAATPEWSFPGEKYGWSYRIKDSRRVLVYLLPRDKFFKVAFVFGEKAFKQVLENSGVPQNIKKELQEAKAYAEGRGIRIDMKDRALLPVIKTLIDIKLGH